MLNFFFFLNVQLKLLQFTDQVGLESLGWLWSPPDVPNTLLYLNAFLFWSTMMVILCEDTTANNSSFELVACSSFVQAKMVDLIFHMPRV